MPCAPASPLGQCWLWTEKGFDGPAFIHGGITLGYLAEWQFQVEYLAGIDCAFPDKLDEVWKVSRTGAGPP